MSGAPLVVCEEGNAFLFWGVGGTPALFVSPVVTPHPKGALVVAYKIAFPQMSVPLFIISAFLPPGSV